MKNFIIQSLILFLVNSSLLAQPGSLDDSFGTNGKVSTGFGRSEAYGNAVAIQPDGKILCGGTAYMANAAGDFRKDSHNATLIRYNPDGSRDVSFGDNGMVFNRIEATGTNGINTIIYYIKVLDDGRILTYGVRSLNALFGGGLLLTMYHPDGSVDVSFGNDGLVFSSISPNSFGTPMIIQSDNKIVVLGGIYQSFTDATQSTATWAMQRYNADGSLDITYGSNGQVLSTFGTLLNYPGCLALQDDGKIVASGSSGNGRLLLARYTTTGAFDNTFDGDGKVVTAFGISNNSVYVDVLPNGKIQSAGTTGTSAGSHFAITQYNTNGSLDLTFDGDGRSLALFDVNDTSDRIDDISKQADGKYLVNTRIQPMSEFGNPEDFVVRRYNSDGAVDNTFGTNGKVFTALGLGSISKQTTTQEDGKILLVGYSQYLLGQAPIVIDFNVLRYNSDGTLDTSFNNDGIISEKVESSNDNGCIVLKQNDGKLLLIGNQRNNKQNSNTNSEIAMARYNQNGSLDVSFGTDGKSISVFGQNVNNVRKAALQPDGKILVMNEYFVWSPQTNGQEVIRFNSDGTLDVSFGTSGKINISSSFFSSLAALHVQEDGSFLVLNQGINPFITIENSSLILRHFNSDGSLNTSFGNAGAVYFEGVFSTSPDPEIVVQTDGKILISLPQQGSNGSGFSLKRINSDGTIDASFENEILVTDIQTAPNAVFLEPDGKIIVAGVSTAVNGFYVFNNFITARYNANGSLDTSYGTNGVLSTFLGDQQSFLYSIVKSVLRQTDGKFLVGLTRYEQNVGNPSFENYDFAVYRFNTNGEYDNNFGNAGKVFTSFFNKYDELFSMVLQNDNKIVLAGTTDNGTTRDFALTRLENCINASAEVSINLCAGDSYTVNNQTYTESGVYETTLTTTFGCDSLLTLNLTFDTLNTEISLSDNMFTALNLPQNAQLQWLNCDDNFDIIIGETNPTFTASLDGNYALETSSANCRDTSNCILFSSVGLHSITSNQFKIYPIPANETLIIESELLDLPIRIFDAQGKLIFETISNSKRMEINVRLFQSGLYFIQSGNTSQPFTILHNR